MKNSPITSQVDIISLSIDYFAHMITSEEFFLSCGIEENEDSNIILGEAQQAWDSAPCDQEGATKEQDVFLNSILENLEKDLKK